MSLRYLYTVSAYIFFHFPWDVQTTLNYLQILPYIEDIENQSIICIPHTTLQIGYPT